MKRTIATLALIASTCTINACAQNAEPTQQVKPQNQNAMTTEKASSKVLVAYFSRADENYSVGYITKGNTEIIAEMIAQETSADLFHIETITAYPKEYKPCIDVAKKELNTNARPEIKGDIKVEDYDMVYLGYPNWWGKPPMAVYTFIEKHSWQGKTVIPFCTHEGSGLGSTERSIKNACKGATMQKGLAIRGATAQNSRNEAKGMVLKWLER